MGRHIDPNIQYEEDGKPIVNGSAYFGVANQDPVLNPITIYSDRNVSVPITNPQPTDSQGRLINEVYVAVNQYSYQVNDSLGNQQSLQLLLEPLNTVGLVTADIDMNGFKVTNAGDATVNTDYATFGQNNELYGQVVDSDGTSAPDAIVANFPVSPSALLNGQQITVNLQHAANTIAVPTFKLNDFSAKDIVRDSNDALSVGDTTGTNGYIDLVYNLSLDKYVLLNPFITNDGNFLTNTIDGNKLAGGSVDLAKIKDLLQSRVIGREKDSGTGAPVALTPPEIRAIIGFEIPNYYLDRGVSGLNVARLSASIISVTEGQIVDTQDSTILANSSLFTKSINNNWAEGTGNGGFPSALTLTGGVWYRVFIIGKPDLTTDYGFDTSFNATNLLSDAAGDGYTLFRRIGWVRAASGTTMTAMHLDGKLKYALDAPSVDLSTGTPSTVGANITLRVPPSTRAQVSAVIKVLGPGLITDAITLTQIAQTNRAADDSHGSIAIDVATGNRSNSVTVSNILASSSSQIRYRTSGAAGDQAKIITLGWEDDLENA
jgi:hypothetical protein